MKTLNIYDAVDALEDEDDEHQAFYLRDSGDIVFDRPEDGRKYIPLPDKSARNDYHTMELFIETLENPTAREWLDNAIRGKGAFRRFKGACEKFHVLNDWYDFEYQQHIDLIISWCEENGILYDMKQNDYAEEDEDDVSDFYHEDFQTVQEVNPVQEELHNPVHVIDIHEENLMNALYAVDGFRMEVKHVSSDLDKAEDVLRRALKNGLIIRGASDQGRIVGLVIVEKTSEEEIIRLLYVAKDRRREGIGRMLMKSVMPAEGGLATTYIDQSAGFFKKLGFGEEKSLLYDKQEK